MSIGSAILGMVSIIIFAMISVLVGQIIFNETSAVFENTSPGWGSTYESLASTLSSVSILGMVFAGVLVLFFVVVKSFGGDKTGWEPRVHDYPQEPKHVEPELIEPEEGDTVIALNCRNCGGPLKNARMESPDTYTCPYCYTPNKIIKKDAQ